MFGSPPAVTPPPPAPQPPVFQADAAKKPKAKPTSPTFLGTGDIPQQGQVGQKTLLGT